MNVRMQRLGAAGVALLGGLASPARAQVPEEFTNLQVLPEDIGRRELTGVMRGFAMGLGVRCVYCHVGEEGQPFSEYDFASDDRAPKRKARFMMQMVRALNDETLPRLSDVADRHDPPVEVRCMTCHRGVALPLPIEEVLAQAIGESGAAAGIARYRELRESYYGSGSYDFGEQPLVDVATGLARGGDPDAALSVLDLALEFHPESVQALVGKAQVHMARQEIDAARAALLRARELAPDAPQIQRMLDRLDGGL